MADLSLTNVITVQVSQAPAGLNQYNTSNLALFTDETPDPVFSDDYKIYKEPVEVGEDFGTDSKTYKMALKVFSQSPNILANGGSLIVIPLEASETLDEAIARTASLVQYFGLMSTTVESSQDTEDAADVVQALNKIAFFVQRTEAAINPSGLFDDLRVAGMTKSRCLYYGGEDDISALEMKAAYAGRALSTVFSGSNTAQTMHLKDLTGIEPDPSMDQTILEKAQAAGADVYASFQGVAKVFTSGENQFFDQVYNLGWFVGDIKIKGFNYLAQSSTKIPQTEQGMSGLKGAYRKVCEQALTNGYAAPGEWNSPTTFGNQADMLQNIRERGYYIYSAPVALQSQADREDRKAPLVQIALKEAGAIQSSTIIIYVNP